MKRSYSPFRVTSATSAAPAEAEPPQREQADPAGQDGDQEQDAEGIHTAQLTRPP